MVILTFDGRTINKSHKTAEELISNASTTKNNIEKQTIYNTDRCMLRK